MLHHVLHILDTAQPEGTAFIRMVGPLVRELNPNKYRTHVWFLGKDGPLVSELQAAGAQVRVIQWNGRKGDLAGAWRFWHCLRKEQFAIIHQHSGGRLVRWLARAASQAGIVVHLWAREIGNEDPRPVPRRVSVADVVIACSHAVAEIAVGLRPYVVYPGVPVPQDSTRGAVSQPKTGKIVGTARRLVPTKGIVYLLRALSLLRAELPDVRLEIAGSGPEQSHLENEVDSLSLAEHVTFLGWQTDIPALLARWDVFAMPSLEEGFGIAALEAMAAGLPVVATAVGGIPELVEDGRTGWLVPPGDSAALGDRLRVLLLNPEQRSAMGANGRARVRECFSIDRMVGDISRIYDEVLGQRANPKR